MRILIAFHAVSAIDRHAFCRAAFARQLLFEENLSEVNCPIFSDPYAYGSQIEIRREDVCAVAGAIHPAMKARGYRIHIAVRISQVLTYHSPLDVRFLNPLFYRAALGIVV